MAEQPDRRVVKVAAGLESHPGGTGGTEQAEERLFDIIDELITFRVFGEARGASMEANDERGRVPGRPSDSAEVDGLREEFAHVLKGILSQ